MEYYSTVIHVYLSKGLKKNLHSVSLPLNWAMSDNVVRIVNIDATRHFELWQTV